MTSSHLAFQYWMFQWIGQIIASWRCPNTSAVDYPLANIVKGDSASFLPSPKGFLNTFVSKMTFCVWSCSSLSVWDVQVWCWNFKLGNCWCSGAFAFDHRSRWSETLHVLFLWIWIPKLEVVYQISLTCHALMCVRLKENYHQYSVSGGESCSDFESYRL